MNDMIDTLRNYEGDKELLAAPERYMLAIIEVKGFEERLRALKFSYNYKEMV